MFESATTAEAPVPSWAECPAEYGLDPDEPWREEYDLPEFWYDDAEFAPDQAPAAPAALAGLAAELSSLRPDELGADAVLDAVSGWERLIAHAQAHQLQLLARFAALRPAEDRRPVSEFAADEVALELRLTGFAAGRRLALATDLTTRLQDTLAALQAGRIDLGRAQVVSDGTAGLPQGLARAVEAEVLPSASTQNASKLRACVQRAVLRSDPIGAECRHRERRSRRHVRIRPCQDGMAELGIYGAAPDVVAARSYLDQLARHSRAAGDDRTLDQLRTDHALDLLTGQFPAAQTGPAAAEASPDGAQPPPTPSGSAASGSGKRQPYPSSPDGRSLFPLVQVTVGASTLLGSDDHPADLAGYGPISAEIARDLARGGTWRRLLTDPVSGTLLDYGRRTYRPPAGLAAHVRARDATCVFPGCTRPARGCDLDHTKPYPAGPTAVTNLGALCRHHHRLKQQAGWTVSQRDGAFTWTTPTGRTHTRPAVRLAET